MSSPRLGYLLGSIPFGLVLTRLAGLGDIRGSARAISARPTCCAPAARRSPPLTLLLDVAKGAAAVLIGGAVGRGGGARRGRSRVIIGHMFPVWLGFRGGKGVATALGVLLALAWPVGVIAAALVWLATAR